MSRIGKVKSWSDEKGFGFILPQEQGNDIFVHRKIIGMQSSLVPGKEVRYDYALDKGKPQATTVHGEGVIKRTPAAIGFGAPKTGGADMQMGIIKSWLPEKGYGFIGMSLFKNSHFFFKKKKRRRKEISNLTNNTQRKDQMALVPIFSC